MKSALIHIVLNIFLVDDDILLIENALVAANETIDLDVIAQQAIYDVMATWALPTIETNSNSYFFGLWWFGGRRKGHYLMTMFRKEGKLSIHE